MSGRGLAKQGTIALQTGWQSHAMLPCCQPYIYINVTPALDILALCMLNMLSMYRLDILALYVLDIMALHRLDMLALCWLDMLALYWHNMIKHAKRAS